MGRVLIIIVGIASCASIIVGYKTKFAAAVMLSLLFVYNVVTNQFWSYGARDARRDFLRYEFSRSCQLLVDYCWLLMPVQVSFPLMKRRRSIREGSIHSKGM